MRTKIIATLGPASASREVIRQLVDTGVSIFRLNFSHGDLKFFENLVGIIRAVEEECGMPLSILQDLPGPKIRIGILPAGTLEVSHGSRLILGAEGKAGDEFQTIPFDDARLLSSLEVGDRLVLADGSLRFLIDEIMDDGRVLMQSLDDGIITSRKGLALPGKSIPLPALTAQDREYVLMGLKLGVDAVALSFVQGPEDVRQLKTLLRAHKSSIPVMAKLERQNAVDNLEEIIQEADMLMVARGDLGVECALSSLPATQKRIIRACNLASKPVVVATQMLLSMVKNPSPTRAEITDVANAVLDGADCVMLSEETAMGKYPVETVAYMSQITQEAENYLAENHDLKIPSQVSGTPEFLAYAACLLADKTKAFALVAHSVSGASARLLSVCRPRHAIHALTPDRQVMHSLNFVWGVIPHFVRNEPDVSHLRRVQRFIAATPDFPRGAELVITAGEPTPGEPNRGTNLVKIYRK